MRALVTIEFDDNWGSNFTHAAGALEARGLTWNSPASQVCGS